jgi:hypothetical protein
MHAPANPPALPIDTCRHDGWTRQRRRRFLEALAEGHRVERACAQVGMSKTSAYKLRRRDPRFAFAWSAALQYARPDPVVSLANPAIDDEVRMIARKDGSVVRHHGFDNRAALAQLSRLDRMIARLASMGMGQPGGAAPTGVAQDFNCLADPVPAEGAKL